MKKLIGTLMVIFPVLASAGAMTGSRKILEIGCHNDNSGICFLTLEGSPVGAPGCSSVSVRWDASNVSGGKNSLTLLTAAYYAGKPVNLFILDTCFAAQPSCPTFGYFVQ